MRRDIEETLKRKVRVKVSNGNQGLRLTTTTYGEEVAIEELFHGLVGHTVIITVEKD